MLKLFVVVLCAAAAVHAAEDIQYAAPAPIADAAAAKTGDDFELRK